MKFPFIIKQNLTQDEEINFLRRFARPIRENIWRRHQCYENADLSEWRNEFDQRRRIVHYLDHYCVSNHNFCLESCYFLDHRKLLPQEAGILLNSLLKMLHTSGWARSGDYWTKEDLNVCIRTGSERDYATLNFILHSHNFTVDDQLVSRPFDVFALGMREKGRRESPRYTAPQDILGLLPAQVELGSGPSVEAGIPPLHSLHRIYNLWTKTNKFQFKGIDPLATLLKLPELKYKEITAIHGKTLVASPTPFYLFLKELHDKEVVVGDILTNNFDGLCSSVGLQEHHLRSYDSTGIYPQYTFHPDAKSLLVIGSHADRRFVQKAARDVGLPIIFVDPEVIVTDDGLTIPYPIEGPQNDLIIKMSANGFAEALSSLL